MLFNRAFPTFFFRRDGGLVTPSLKAGIDDLARIAPQVNRCSPSEDFVPRQTFSAKLWLQNPGHVSSWLKVEFLVNDDYETDGSPPLIEIARITGEFAGYIVRGHMECEILLGELVEQEFEDLFAEAIANENKLFKPESVIA